MDVKKYVIEPIAETTAYILNKIRETFGLNEYPFVEIDDNILLLAFTPQCDKNVPEYQVFIDKYGTCDHQTLEFYGDRILYGIIADISYDFFELTMNPHFYSSLDSLLGGNRLLTDLMMDKNACELVRSKKFYIDEQAKSFHNRCADTLEALIGAMYVHFRTKKTPYTSHIKNWLLKNTALPYVLKSYLNESGFPDKPVYIVNDKTSLMKKWLEERRQIRENIISNKRYVDPYNYNNILSRLDKDLKVSEQDFAFSGFIVNPTTSILEIFSYLKWNYTGPIWNKTDNMFYIEGFPNGISSTIGIGRDVQSTISDAFSFLFGRGYIVPMRSINLYYTSKRSFGSPKSPNIIQTRSPRSPNITQPVSNITQPRSPKAFASRSSTIPQLPSPQANPINIPPFIPRSTQPINVPTYQQTSGFTKGFPPLS